MGNLQENLPKRPFYLAILLGGPLFPKISTDEEI
jgi:hypothetical protein